MGYIYLIQWHNPAMTMYIGSSQDYKKRWNEHSHRLRKGTHDNPKMQLMYEKGYDVSFFVLEETTRPMLEVEQEWLDAFDATRDRAFANIAQAFGGRTDHIKNDKPVVLVRESDKQQIEKPSSREAAKYLGCSPSSVAHVLRGDWYTIKGHRVFFKGQVPEEFERIPKLGEQVAVAVRLTNKETGATHDFDTITEAAIFLGDVKRVGNICHVLRGRFKSTFGYTAERL